MKKTFLIFTLLLSSMANAEITPIEVIEAFRNQFGGGKEVFLTSLQGKTSRNEDCTVSIRVERYNHTEGIYKLIVDARTDEIHYKKPTFPTYLSTFKNKSESSKILNLKLSPDGGLEKAKLKFKQIELDHQGNFHRSWEVFSNYNTHKIDVQKVETGFQVKVSFTNHYPVLGMMDSYSSECTTDSITE